MLAALRSPVAPVRVSMVGSIMTAGSESLSGTQADFKRSVRVNAYYCILFIRPSSTRQKMSFRRIPLEL